MQVRSYTESDEPAVVALWREVFPDAPARNDPRRDIQRKRETQPEGFLVATIEGLVVGTAMAGFDGHRGWVYYLAVHPDHRRKGIGSALMSRVESELATAGCTKLNLQVRASNPGAVAFYRDRGYAVEERVSLGKVLGAGP